MEKKIKLILGNITFSGFEHPKALVHEIYGIINCETEEQAEKIGDDLCILFSDYIIPSAFNGKIELEKGCKKTLTA